MSSDTFNHAMETLDAIDPQWIDDVGANPSLKELCALIAVQGLMDTGFRDAAVAKAAKLARSPARTDRVKAYVLVVPFYEQYPKAQAVFDELAHNAGDLMKRRTKPWWKVW